MTIKIICIFLCSLSFCSFSYSQDNKEEHLDDHTHNSEPEMKAFFAFRVGIIYGFHLGKLSVAPAVNYDMGESNVLVYGLNIGIGF